MVSCKYCGSLTPLESCPERGESVCTECGAVCNESNIVTEVSFDKDSGGTSVFGQLLYADGLTSYERRKLSKSTIGQARKRLMCLGAKLLTSPLLNRGQVCFLTNCAISRVCIVNPLIRAATNKAAPYKPHGCLPALIQSLFILATSLRAVVAPVNYVTDGFLIMLIS